MSAPVYWSSLILFLDSVCNFLCLFSHLHFISPTNVPTFLSYMVQGQIASAIARSLALCIITCS